MKVGCAAYSYRDYLLEQTKGPRQAPMSLLGFLDTAVELGLDGIELTTYYFPYTDHHFLKMIKREAFVRGLQISGTAIGNDFCLPDAAARQAQVQMCKDWVDHSVVLGAPSLRVFAGPVHAGQTEEETRGWCAACLREVALYGEKRGVLISLENHGGITATAPQVLALLELAGADWLRLNLDLGNFGPNPYEQMAQVAQHAVTAHAKVSWYEHQGEQTIRHPIDYPRVKQVLDAVNYRGFLNIEYEEEEDPRTAVPKLVSRLKSVFAS